MVPLIMDAWLLTSQSSQPKLTMTEYNINNSEVQDWHQYTVIAL